VSAIARSATRSSIAESLSEKIRRAVTPDEFSRLALSQPGVVAKFARVVQTFGVAKIVRKFGVPTSSLATIQLTSEQQAILMQAAPRLSCRCRVAGVLILAWRNVALDRATRERSMRGWPSDAVVNGFASALRATSICCGVIVGKNARGMH
jgi:hypothetical protein